MFIIWRKSNAIEFAMNSGWFAKYHCDKVFTYVDIRDIHHLKELTEIRWRLI